MRHQEQWVLLLGGLICGCKPSAEAISPPGGVHALVASSSTSIEGRCPADSAQEQSGVRIGCSPPPAAHDLIQRRESPLASIRPSELGQQRVVSKLLIRADSIDFSYNSALLKRIVRSPHGYFRFINERFSRAVCEQYQAAAMNFPLVNLHGDAHLEQYALTDEGRGLTDFDDSARGAAVLDLLRFGVSIHLALKQYRPRASSTPFFEKFLSGYRHALEKPEVAAPEPRIVTKLRSTFGVDREQYFDWVRSVMNPVTDERAASLRNAFLPYVGAMKKKYAKLSSDYFRIREIGSLNIGIGSALDEKYLVRIQGPSLDKLDDIILEVKEVRSLQSIDCVESVQYSDPIRILLANTRIAYRPYWYLGYIRLGNKSFWIHAWSSNYKELDLGTLATKADDLLEVVYDVGMQLGRGHPKVADEFDHQLRHDQLVFLDKYQEQLTASLEVYGAATIQAWMQFKQQLRETDALPKEPIRE